MQEFLAGKPEATVRRALQALIGPLMEEWGDVQAFKAAAQPILSREAGGLLPTRNDTEGIAERVWAQVLTIRGTYFRVIASTVDAEDLHKRLDKTFAASPFAQGCLWLTFRLQHTAINFMASQDGNAARAKAYAAIDDRKSNIEARLKAMNQPSLNELEQLIFEIAKEAIDGPPFDSGATSGYLLEKIRAAARSSELLNRITAEVAEDPVEIPMLNLFVGPVRDVELDEARTRFSRLGEQDREQRYTAYRKSLVRVVAKTAQYAQLGFEPFCQATENEMFPYPRPLEWIRSFLKPLFTNAASTSIYDNCATPQSIEMRYENLREEKSANIVILELGRALARSRFKEEQTQALIGFINDLDLTAEFDWPRSVSDFLGQRSSGEYS